LFKEGLKGEDVNVKVNVGVITITQSEIGGGWADWRRIYVSGRKAGDLKTPSTDWGRL